MDSQAPVKLVVEYEKLDDFLVDYSANENIGGMFIQSSSPLPPSTILLVIFIVNDQRIEAEGEVHWTLNPEEALGTLDQPNFSDCQPGMGVSFKVPSPKDRVMIEGWFNAWE